MPNTPPTHHLVIKKVTKKIPPKIGPTNKLEGGSPPHRYLIDSSFGDRNRSAFSNENSAHLGGSKQSQCPSQAVSREDQIPIVGHRVEKASNFFTAKKWHQKTHGSK